MREAWATWECKRQAVGREARREKGVSFFVNVVDPSSYAHVTQLGREGKREGAREVRARGFLRSLAEVERVLCMAWMRRRRRRRREGAKRREEKADLLDLLAQYYTTDPPRES